MNERIHDVLNAAGCIDQTAEMREGEALCGADYPCEPVGTESWLITVTNWHWVTVRANGDWVIDEGENVFRPIDQVTAKGNGAQSLANAIAKMTPGMTFGDTV